MPEQNAIVAVISALIAAISMFFVALHKDNRTHKRIDGAEKWIGKVEEESRDGLDKVVQVVQDHTEMVIKHYPDTDAMDKALKPISEKIDVLSQGVTHIKSAIDLEQKEKLKKQDETIRDLQKQLDEAKN